MKLTAALVFPITLSSVLAACSDSGTPTISSLTQTPVPNEPAPNSVTPPTAMSAEPAQQAPSIDPSALARFAALRAPAEASPRAELGKRLFYEARLSKSGKLSCNSCHALSQYGVDHQRFSMGHDMQLGGRNAPGVYNAAAQLAQFWDGRAPDVEEQAKGPILNPVEMAMPDAAAVEAVLRADEAYVAEFGRAFPGETQPVTFDNLGRAIGAFERRLFPSSRWDRFLRGEKEALVAAEIEGFATFVKVGCASCHAGELVGGGSFKKLGLAREWTRDGDLGRVAVTGDARDRRVFKVATLRNIAQTSPYFHDGSVETLEEAVRLMGQAQLDVDLAEHDVVSIVTWLRSLTADLPRDIIEPPVR